MWSIFTDADAVLRGSLRVTSPQTSRLPRLVAISAGCGLFYGAVMGTFGGLGGERIWQVFISAVKVPLLLGVTFAISLPSFFVLNTLMGLRDDFAQSLRALLATQAGLALVLAGLAPFTILWYVSSRNYNQAILFNAAMFGIASLSSQYLLRIYYRPLIQRSPRHRSLLRVWLLVFGFVGIQLSWMLRPFVGAPDRPVEFLRHAQWGNAYENFAAMAQKAVRGR